MAIQQDLQQSVLSAVVELYEIDLNPIGVNQIFYLTPTPNGSDSIVFDGKTYIPFPIQGDGWESASDGASPQPTLQVSNVTKYIQGYLFAYQDMVGAKVNRVLTLQSALSDPSKVFSSQSYVIIQLETQTKDQIVFKLSSVLDTKMVKLPRRQVLRSVFPGAGLFRG